MMDFRGINAKIERSRNQIATLSADIDELCGTIRRSIVHEVHREAGVQMWVFRGDAPDVPIEWSIRVGEVLYNLRSALDHLVWQLVLANGREPTRDNQFPILNEEEEWTHSRTVKILKGISDENSKRIRSLQPFNAPLGLRAEGSLRGFDAHPLRTLNDLCNIDKHRHLNLTFLATRGTWPISRDSSRTPDLELTDTCRISNERGEVLSNMVFRMVNSLEEQMRPRFVVDMYFSGTKQKVLTSKSVKQQLRECLETVRGGCELFRHL